MIERTQLMHERMAAPQAQQIVTLQIDPFCAAYPAIAEAFLVTPNGGSARVLPDLLHRSG